MKKYTYTNMRTELSDILDKLRMGELITITQRGKEDLVLQGSLANTTALDEKAEKLTGINHIDEVLRSHSFKQSYRVMQSPNYKLIQEITQSPAFKTNVKVMKEIKRAMPSVSSRFIEALTLTQKKHANIIKKLEDS